MASAGVEMRRWQTWLLVALGALACVAVGVFIGYQSVPPREPAALGDSTDDMTSRATPPPQEAALPPTPQPAVTAGRTDAERGEPSEGQSAGDAPPPSTADSASTREQVRAYFAETDRLLASAKQAGDPNTIARKILEQSASGDTSGLEQMLRTQRALAQRLSAVAAPAPCVEHHRRSVALVEKSANMLAEVVATFRSGDTSGLLGLGVAGQEIETEARALDAIAANIRKQHGLQ